MSRVLIISGAYPPFKAPESAHALFLAESLAGQMLDVHVLTRHGIPQEERHGNGITLHAIMPDWTWRQMGRMTRFLRTNCPDVILLLYIDWIYASHPMITFAPWLARQILPQTLFVTQLENENGQTGVPVPRGIKQRVMRRLMSLRVGPRNVHPSYGTLLRDSGQIIVLSERHREAFSLAHPGVERKAHLIPAPPLLPIAEENPQGAVRRRGRLRLGLAASEIAIIYFGYIYPLKDLETLLAAFARLPAYTRLIIVGDGEESYVNSLKDRSRRAGRAEHVLWTGYCPPDDETASVYLRAADFCVLPFAHGLRLNNSSFAVAVTHGLPVISTRGRSVEEAFVEGENVRLCPPGDVAALAKAMLETAESPALRHHLSQGARNLAQTWFSAERIMHSTMRALGLPDAVTPKQTGCGAPTHRGGASSDPVFSDEK
jgi:glycosyltransferase involved in cell wall biosynthesis